MPGKGRGGGVGFPIETQASSKVMLAVHWAPVSATKRILKNGIVKSNKGLYCFPLTGHKALDRWWLNFFNQCGVRQRKKYNGIVFRVKQQDLPAYFGHWGGATNQDTFKKEILTLKQLGIEFKKTIIWRLGEMLAREANIDTGVYEDDNLTKLYLKLAEEAIKKSPKILTSKLENVALNLHAS